jgi:sulfide:quinone oxidoreductase
VYAVPGGVSWPLPAYELALLTRTFLESHGALGVSVSIVTPEPEPLSVFGPEASAAMAELLQERNVDAHCQQYAGAFKAGVLQIVPDGGVEADVVVALPRLEGPAVPGVPSDGLGFVPTDELGRVDDLEGVYAAGDMTAFPIKQGGIAAQQADAAAHTIAVQAGAPVELEPFRAVLRGLLLTGLVPRFLRTDLTAWPSGDFQVDTNPLWWPPAKIAGRYLGPFLARHAGFEDRSGPPPDGIPVEIDLSARIP